MLAKNIVDLLEKREFVSVATCDLNARPYAASKFLLKVTSDSIYLVDYTIGATCSNIKINPRISISFLDPHTLTGYQLNGKAWIIDRGIQYQKMHKEMLDKEVRLTTKHIIEDLRNGTDHKAFEVVITEKFIILKVRVDEIVEIGIKGELVRKKVTRKEGQFSGSGKYSRQKKR